VALARIQVPTGAKRGDVVEIRIVILHPMETGFRREGGERVKRNAIHSFVCKYGGVEVFRATLSTGIAANPSLRFWMTAVETGDLDFWWLDDEDIEGTAKARLVVA
jgi:sulfur-oxidizing protein SoxZ